VIWAIGNTVSRFLDGKQVVTREIIHFSGQNAAKQNESVRGKESEFREFSRTVSVNDISRTARDVTTGAGFAPGLVAAAVARVEKSELTDSRKKLIFAYKTEFEK